MEIESDFSANKYFTKYDLLLPRLRIVQPKPVGKATCFIDKEIIVIELVRKKLSNMMPGVFSKSMRDYLPPIFDHYYNSERTR